MKRVKVLLWTLIIALLGGCANSESSIPGNEPAGEHARALYKDLVGAYQEDCVSCLKDILDEWSNTYEPATDIPDSLKEVYHVYSEVYTPWDLGRMSDSEWGDDIYRNISYYIVQTSIRYGYHFGEYVDEAFIINNFMPLISGNETQVLYLTEEYNSAINYFLGTDYIPVGLENSTENVVKVPALPAGESVARAAFLENHLKLFSGYWWHIMTHPQVLQISFNGQMDQARVDFRLAYEGGEVFLAKEGNDWKIEDYNMTWVD